MKSDRKHAKLENGARKRHRRALTASQLAPAEELVATDLSREPAAGDGIDPDQADRGYIDGSLVLDGEHLKLPRHLLPSESGRRASWLSPVFVVVVTLALGFTGFVTYLISVQTR